MAQADDHLGQLARGAVGQHGLHETAVDFQVLYREAGEVMQVGKSGAEVVDGQADAVLLEQRERLAQGIGVAHQCRFGQFQFQAFRVPMGRGANAQHALGEVGIAQLHGGDVDRDPRKYQATSSPRCGLLARFGQHPVADRDDLAAVLGHGDEFVRWPRFAGAGGPAQQCLDTDRLAGGAIDRGLICKPELVAAQCGAQLVFHGEAALHPLQEGIGVELERIATKVLGGVHGGIGGAHQIVEIGARFVPKRDTDTGADVQVDTGQCDRLLQRGEDFARDNGGVVGTADVAQQDQELIAAEAANDVMRAYTRAQAAAHLEQQLIADGMTHRVVDVLEAVQIDEQQRQHGLAAARVVDRIARALVKQEPVGQAGKRIVMRKLLDALARFVLLGDVLDQPDDAVRHIVFVFQFGRATQPHPASVGCEQRQFQIVHRHAGGNYLLYGILQALARGGFVHRLDFGFGQRGT